ncbi:MAG: hypothetical protein ACE5ES_01555 [Candidatus Nanoarchaeia archaeon]
MKKLFKKNQISTYFLKYKLRELRKNLEIYSDVLEFLKKHDNCIIFISVDNNQYKNFMKLINVVDGANITVVRESDLKRGTPEYQMSLILDTLLNLERRKQ